MRLGRGTLSLLTCLFLTTIAQAQFVIPTSGTVTTKYLQMYEFGTHSGVDVAKVGEKVRAAASGKVVWVTYTASGYGHHLVIYHGVIKGKHTYTLYGHMGERDKPDNSYVKVRIGMDVSAGEEIGQQGNSGSTFGTTGIHLHFEVRIADDLLTDSTGRITWDRSRLGDTIHVDPSDYIGLQVKSGTKTVGSMTAQSCDVRTSESKFFPLGSLVNHRGTISRVSSNERRQYSLNAFLSYFPGFCSTVLSVDPNDFEMRYPKGVDMPIAPSKRLITYSGGPVYYVDGDGKAHALTSAAVMYDLGISQDFTGLQTLPRADIERTISSESPIWDSPFHDGVLIRGINDPTVYVITGGQKRGITADAYRVRGDRSRDVLVISDAIVAAIDTFLPPITIDTVTGGDSRLRVMALTEAASFSEKLAPSGIIALFGDQLSNISEVATRLPLPTDLAGTRGTIKDSTNNSFQLPLFFVSPSQVNAQVPDNVAEGTASLEIQSPNGRILKGRRHG